MDYHPGGWDELLRGAGKDATELFNEVHRWVNYDSMLSACLVGKLEDGGSEQLSSLARRKPSSPLPSAKPGERRSRKSLLIFFLNNLFLSLLL